MRFAHHYMIKPIKRGETVGGSYKSSTNQIKVVKDESGFVHLPKNKQHLIVYELFVLLQVAVHLLFQLITNLRKNTHHY